MRNFHHVKLCVQIHVQAIRCYDTMPVHFNADYAETVEFAQTRIMIGCLWERQFKEEEGRGGNVRGHRYPVRRSPVVDMCRCNRCVCGMDVGPEGRLLPKRRLLQQGGVLLVQQ